MKSHPKKRGAQHVWIGIPWATALIVTALWFPLGCGAASREVPLFTTDFAPDGDVLSRLLEQLSGASSGDAAFVAIGATGSQVKGVNLRSGHQWEQRIKSLSTPVLAGEIVLLTTRKLWIALSATSGDTLWEIPSEKESLRGVADDGTRSMLSVYSTRTGRNGLISVERDGSYRYRREVSGKLGQPTALNNLAFVPWNQRFVSAIDLASGVELWRFKPNFTVTWAERRGNMIWFGGTGLGHIGPRSRDGAVATLDLPSVGLETLVAPLPGSLPPMPMSSAPASVDSLLFPISLSKSVSSSPFAAVNGSTIVGFNDKHALQWVGTHPTPILAARSTLGGYVLCEASGRIISVSNGGATAKVADFGASLKACSLGTALPSVEDAGTDVPLVDQLASAIRTSSGEHLLLGHYLARQLAKLQDAEATRILIELASDPHLPPKLMQTLDEALAGRRVGKQFMLDALRRHFDFLDNSLHPPPVGPLADALAALGEVAAAPLLAKHLSDPANSADAVRRAARGLQTLATSSEAPALRTFLTLYRATADRRELVEAVVFVARALLRLGGRESRALVERAASDALTQPEVRLGLEAVLRSSTGAPPRGDTQ